MNKFIQQKLLPSCIENIKQEYKEISNRVYNVAYQNRFLTNTQQTEKRKNIKVATPSVLILTNNDYDTQQLKDNLFTFKMIQDIVVRSVQEYTEYFTQQMYLLQNSCDVLITSINNLIYLKNRSIIGLNILQDIIAFLPDLWNYNQQAQLIELYQQFKLQGKQKFCIVSNDLSRLDNLTQQNQDIQNDDVKNMIQDYQQIKQEAFVIKFSQQKQIKVQKKQMDKEQLNMFIQQLEGNNLIIYNGDKIQFNNNIYNIFKNDYNMKIQTYRQYIQTSGEQMFCEQKESFNSFDKLFNTVIEECKNKAIDQFIDILIAE